MMRLPDIFIPASEGFPSDVVNVAQTITLQSAGAAPLALITDSMGDNGTSIFAGLGMLFVVVLILRRMSRKARAKGSSPQDTGQSFAASVDIPPYIDTSNLEAIAANIDPEEAAVRLSNTWMGARKKVEANPLYSPNGNECMARDAVEIERIFCSGQLAKCLSKQPAEAFDRFASTAKMLGSTKVAELIGDAKKLAVRGHSSELQNEPRKGEAWVAFRQEIATLQAELRSANAANGSAGRVITRADAYMSEIAA